MVYFTCWTISNFDTNECWSKCSSITVLNRSSLPQRKCEKNILCCILIIWRATETVRNCWHNRLFFLVDYNCRLNITQRINRQHWSQDVWASRQWGVNRPNVTLNRLVAKSSGHHSKYTKTADHFCSLVFIMNTRCIKLLQFRAIESVPV